jgi:tetratricopeptide (TPR) repeat protein
MPLVSLGILWFAVTVLPVSNLFFSTGVLLAERTLYLPSVGLALVAAGLFSRAATAPVRIRRMAAAGAMALGLALFIRTVLRNPSWMSTFVVMQTLNEEHPESWRAFRARALGLERVGEVAGAAKQWDVAVALTPRNYTLLVQAGDFHGRVGDWDLSRSYLLRAIQVAPELANAYQILASEYLRRGEGRAGHQVALQGLAMAGPDPELWALVSESYLLKGDLPAAVRAREAALGVNPEAGDQWHRLGEILEAMGEEERASQAYQRARALGYEDGKVSANEAALPDLRLQPAGFREEGWPG